MQVADNQTVTAGRNAANINFIFSLLRVLQQNWRLPLISPSLNLFPCIAAVSCSRRSYCFWFSQENPKCLCDWSKITALTVGVEILGTFTEFQRFTPQFYQLAVWKNLYTSIQNRWWEAGDPPGLIRFLFKNSSISVPAMHLDKRNPKPSSF